MCPTHLRALQRCARMDSMEDRYVRRCSLRSVLAPQPGLLLCTLAEVFAETYGIIQSHKGWGGEVRLEGPLATVRRNADHNSPSSSPSKIVDNFRIIVGFCLGNLLLNCGVDLPRVNLLLCAATFFLSHPL